MSELIDGTRRYDLTVVGLGYAGLPLALAAAEVGLSVCGFDVDIEKAESLNSGTSHIEDVSNQRLRAALDNGFVVTTDHGQAAKAQSVIISVPTPLDGGVPDLSAVITASEVIGNRLRHGQLVVLESTTYPGTTEEIVMPILEGRSGLTAGIDFYLAYSPERTDPGNPDWSIHNTPKLVAGINEASTERASQLYQKFCPVVTISGTREAEMAKLLENTYRQVNIALVNEFAILCRELGVDIWETIRAAATKPFGFESFRPGPGVGGHCIPIDPHYLSHRVQELGEQFRFIELAKEVNDHMPAYVAHRALALLEESDVKPGEASVLILGVAYKANVADTRETPATDLIRALWASNVRIEYADPLVETFMVDGSAVTRRRDVIRAAVESDLVIVHTPHDELDLQAICSAAPLVLDTTGIAPADAVERI